jgi:hypothetical protein
VRNLQSGGRLAVDPIHNVLVTGGTTTVAGRKEAALLIFNRTDEGDVKPKAVISGPRTGLIGTAQLQIYPEGGWIVTAQSIDDNGNPEPPGSFVGIWSINDHGDVPPRWKIENAMKKPRGVVIDAKHKELIVADMSLNAVTTYSIPEMFEPRTK